ncbi:MAG: 3'-5' exonuclease, partial [Dethiobacteria bacterium]
EPSPEDGENPYALELLLIDRSGAPGEGDGTPGPGVGGGTPGDGERAPGSGDKVFLEGAGEGARGGAGAMDAAFSGAGITTTAVVGDGPEAAGEEELTLTEQASAEEEWERASLEGRLIAQRIRNLMGDGEREPFSIYDRNTREKRPVSYRDIVILLRSARNWAIPVMDELRRYGIPAYADLGTGYFEAVEVEVMLSLLKIIDNPIQDIPLAAVLRSPLVGLSADDLARIRLKAPQKSFYDALLEFCRDAQKDTASSKSSEGDEAFDVTGKDERVRGDQPGGITFCTGNRKTERNFKSCVDDENAGGGICSDNAGTGTGKSDYDVKNGDAGDGKSGGAGESFSPLQEKLSYFLKQLYTWQDKARQGSLAELIWQIYGDTGYYELVGGMPGGGQRQANLRALYDRARQYEATSLRGLFRFLRFIERLQDRGGDLGAARALGEQEDVVRIITVHKSKGLEFPIVFLAGLSKQFNLQDLRQGFLLHKELGFGPRFIDAGLGVSYPTLPWLALKKRLSRELLAEEMRILYVALTRAEEKLILVGTSGNLPGDVRRWEEAARGKAQLFEPGYRLRAKSFLDWIGPAMLRHRCSETLRKMLADPAGVLCSGEEELPLWNVRVVSSRDVIAGEEPGPGEEGEGQILWEKVARLEPVSGGGKWSEEVKRHLEWSYPCRAASGHYAKVSVSEIKKLYAAGLPGDDADEAPWIKFWPHAGPRPRFLEESSLTAAERGTAYHAVMQYISFECAAGPPAVEEISRQMEEMVAAERITEQEREAVDPGRIAAFFETPLGKRVFGANRVRREVPFSMALPAEEVYPGYHDYADYPAAGKQPGKELVLIQGVIDCLAWEDDGGVLLIDFKSDNTSGAEVETLRERYRLQLDLYSRAVEEIWKVKVKGRFLYFFDGGRVVSLDENCPG